MLVKELRKALKKMPGEMNVYLKNGTGVKSASHIVEFNLVGIEQFCEIIGYSEIHSEQMADSLIERETGFANRNELIEAYKLLKGDSRNAC